MRNLPNTKLLDRLMSEGRLTAEGHATVVGFVALHGGSTEDALIDNRLMSEADVLRFVSTLHGTRFVSTEKLYKANIDPKLLQLVPRKLADQHGVIPVIYDDKNVLSIVTGEPENLAAMQEVRAASGVRDVTALYARPAAVRAAIQRFYYNDATAFATLLRSQKQLDLAADPGPSAFRTASITGPSPIQAQLVGGAIPLSFDIAQPGQIQHEAADPFANRITLGATQQELGVAPNVHAQPAAPAAPPPPAASPPAQAPPQASAPYVRPGGRPPETRRPSVVDMRIREPGGATLTTDYLETLNVLISLLEQSRPELHGHSAQCARLMKRLCDRMGLEGAQAGALSVAGYLHDVGKAGAFHLTALNVGEYDGHRTAAQKVGTAPERLFHLVSLHPDTKLAILQMYERFDGKGFPTSSRGKEISLGARMLAVVDSYADLTSNPRNPARRVLKPEEAVQFLGKARGTFFDPSMLDLLGAEVAGDDVRAKLLADRHSVLLVDPDPEETMVLELRMLEAGFDVRIARTAQQATFELAQREFALVVSEVDLDVADAGLSLRSAAASAPWAKSILAWVIHTRKADRQLAEIVFDLGVDDMVSKPTPPDIFVTKMRQLIDRKQRVAGAGATSQGVSGSLQEMALPDLVQVLWHGRKSCAVRLRTARGAGEISFADGQIVDAKFVGKRAEEAFYAMLALTEGEFQIDNTAAASERTIQASPEGLLLEGMRRMDEGLV